MSSKFSQVYNNLNTEQKQAVDNIFGPVLVIAGPGTGKTQLLSARVANILLKTDASPINILCLTFTENGAENMRERLASFIGAEAAYEVEISTYHGFGNSLLAQGSDFLTEDRTSIDQLGQYQIIEEIKKTLPSDNLLAPKKNTVNNIINAINDIKQENISPGLFKKLAQQNLRLIKKTEQYLKIMNDVSGSKKSDTPKKLAAFKQIYEQLKQSDEDRIDDKTPTFLEKIYTSFEEQAVKYDNDPKKSIQHFTTDWHKKFFEKDRYNNYKFKDEFASKKALDLAELYRLYEIELANKDQQDFNDMILRAINLLETEPAFRFSMQEKYQFILLDEYQDTNGSQSKIIELLTQNTQNPDYEPNVLAVGDDDQAIMAFQGAKFSNMKDFADFYSNTKIINLTKNYRSHAKILDFAQNVASQIDSRLTNTFTDISKYITQANDSIQDVQIWRKSFLHQSTEFSEVAHKISTLIDQGVEPKDIAILAPKHAILEEISKYLNSRKIPISYEKSENILDEPAVRQLIQMLKLTQAISQDSPDQNALWVKVLAYDFWDLDAMSIYLEIQKYDKWDQDSPSITKILSESENQKFKDIASLFIALSEQIDSLKLEAVLDILVGSSQLDDNILSPMREYYKEQSDEDLYNLALYLTILRGKFRMVSQTNDEPIFIADFLKMIDLYIESETKILSKNPFQTASNAVQIMTAFSAKGLEFSHTFLISVDDSAWGSGKGNNQTISLPKNMERIKDPNQEDTKKRLFFVAITRAKTNLYLTSSQSSFDGKSKKPLKFLAENLEEQISEVIPEEFNKIEFEEQKLPTIETLELNWNDKFLPEKLKNQQIFSDKANNFSHSASSLTKFFDLNYGGPERFFEEYILNFPKEISGSAQFGTVMHEIFDFWQKQTSNGIDLTLDDILNESEVRINKLKITNQEKTTEIERAKRAFTNYFKHHSHIFKENAKSEVSIRKILLNGQTIIGGKIDRLEINEAQKTIEIVDFKTGNITDKDTFKNNQKLHSYETQLYFYKLLLQHSPDYKNYKVTSARLEFIEGNERDRTPIVKNLVFLDEQLERTKQLILALDNRIKSFDFSPEDTPQIARVADIIKFEDKTIADFL